MVKQIACQVRKLLIFTKEAAMTSMPKERHGINEHSQMTLSWVVINEKETPRTTISAFQRKIHISL